MRLFAPKVLISSVRITPGVWAERKYVVTSDLFVPGSFHRVLQSIYGYELAWQSVAVEFKCFEMPSDSDSARSSLSRDRVSPAGTSRAGNMAVCSIFEPYMYEPPAQAAQPDLGHKYKPLLPPPTNSHSAFLGISLLKLCAKSDTLPFTSVEQMSSIKGLRTLLFP